MAGRDFSVDYEPAECLPASPVSTQVRETGKPLRVDADRVLSHHSCSMAKRTLTVYFRAQCHLCDELFADLAPWRERYGFSVTSVDVDTSADLQARFSNRVPVLAEGDLEICYYFLDEDALLTHLERI